MRSRGIGLSSGVKMQKHDCKPRLRLATNADGGAILELVFEVLREYGLPPDPEDTDVDLADIEGHYRGGWFAVLEVDEVGIIGSVGLCPLEGAVMELRKMYLHRDWRGRGLGRQLMEGALAEARRLGARKLVLGTAGVLSEAVALYKRFGFRPSRHAHPATRVDQSWELDL